MFSLNRISLLGNTGKEPSVKILKNGTKWAEITIATNESYVDKDNPTQRKEEVTWHTVFFYGKIAEIVEKYITKGSKIYVDGKLKSNLYTDKQGIQRKSFFIKADNVIMLDSRSTNGNYAPNNYQANVNEQEQGQGGAYTGAQTAPPNQPAGPSYSQTPAMDNNGYEGQPVESQQGLPPQQGQPPQQYNSPQTQQSPQPQQAPYPQQTPQPQQVQQPQQTQQPNNGMTYSNTDLTPPNPNGGNEPAFGNTNQGDETDDLPF